MGRSRMSGADKILAKIADSTRMFDCWVYTGWVNKSGYGVITWRTDGDERRGLVHRVLYEALVGPIPAGLDLDHLCFNTRCCNPAHLEPVTRSENARRQSAAGRNGLTRQMAAKTHCPRGHEYTPENTRIKPSEGRRRCRTCLNAQRRAARRRKKVRT